jgi:hypothetical protein
MSDITSEYIDLNKLQCARNFSKRKFYATLKILQALPDDGANIVQILSQREYEKRFT